MAGGARGEVLGATSEETAVSASLTSRRTVAGADPRRGTCVATAAPAVEQKGQKCPLLFRALRSAQKWNCAARKTNPNKRAKTLTSLLALNMPMTIIGRKSYSMSIGK